MINNDVLRSLRYSLNINDATVLEVFSQANYSLTQPELAAFLLPEGDENRVLCSDEVMAHFLDGLVCFKRGKNDNLPAQPVQWPINNNVILKKLRVAFELKDADLHDILQAADFPVSKPELSALFRKEGQKNFRPCGDQLLRNFLKGLTLRLRG
ncbi:MAG: hypothetical protein A2Y50_14005 [Pseudomonadales bacterium RIFCSPLOWO2_12_59_9]|jgi:uncharacterized protein YehS (DUF1456 family)|uniref:DUF1456 family protein n=1 Tax=Pseudomonas sp. TaxID=306 RepID=UPI0008C1EF3F|nr:DUF1456 family protein [Pseudomonadaceae bacterium]OHC27162.1 MAG: hypothetical protein A2Y50_14005 [Pseudomonadales bacterium RIFCSPLOWO2_12_59_9]